LAMWMKRLLDRQTPQRLTRRTSVAMGQTYWYAAQNSVPSFPAKVNAREHGIK
jgi:hypothetical protein